MTKLADVIGRRDHSQPWRPKNSLVRRRLCKIRPTHLPFLKVGHESTGCVLRCSNRIVLSKRRNNPHSRKGIVRHRHLLQSPTICFASPGRRMVRIMNVSAVVRSAKRPEVSIFVSQFHVVSTRDGSNCVRELGRHGWDVRTLSIVLFPILVKSLPA